MRQILFCVFFLCYTKASGQIADTTKKKETFVHSPSCYVDFQFPKGQEPMVTTQVSAYAKKMYFEFRYNYEDRKTTSLYIGRSFKFGAHDELELIPMIGGSVGRFGGISPATTAILEAGWIRGFSQNQYSIAAQKGSRNFVFDWTALVLHVYKPLYLGASDQLLAPTAIASQFYYGPMVSVKIQHFYIEGFAYNFWETAPMWAIAMQYNY